MAFDITPYIDKKPSEVRKLIREGVIDFPTAGMCRGYAQANLIILPPEYAGDFEEFAKRNPFPCPILEIIRGTPETHDMGEGGNICTDIPKYRIYRDGKWDGKELTDVSDYWKEGYVGFLIGCSFSFEETLMREGIEIRHIAQGRNVPMFKTNIMTEPAGPFCGPMVCSMRPMTPENAKKAYDITVKMPNVHGAPVHMGDAAEVGVADVMKPDYGEAVDFYEGEIPVFWPCGVTPQAAAMAAEPALAPTPAPGGERGEIPQPAAKTIRRSENLSIDNSDIVDELLDSTAESMAALLSAQNKGGQIAAAQKTQGELEILFEIRDLSMPEIVSKDGKYVLGSNSIPVRIAYINAEIDGISRNIGEKIKLTKGLHTFRISQKDIEPLEKNINVTGDANQRIAFSLQLDDNARNRFKNDMAFIEQMKAKAQASDNARILTEAEADKIRGIAKMFEQSGFKVDAKALPEINKTQSIFGQ